MRLVLAVVCMVCCMSSVAHATPAARTAELVTRADRLLSRGRTTQALVLLRRAYGRAPSVTLAHKIASALLPEPETLLHIQALTRDRASIETRAEELVQLVDALPAATTAEEREQVSELWRRRAWAQAWLGRGELAVSTLRERGGYGDTHTLRYLRGVAALMVSMGDLPSAEEALEVARRFLPDDGTLTSELAAILLAQGRAEDAIPLWEALLHKDANNLDVRRDLAGALLAAGRGAEAVALLEAAKEACDAAPPCAIEAARASLEMGDAQAAVARLEKPMANDKVEALLLLADAHTRLKAWQQAREAYAQVLVLKPNHVRARENLRALEARVQETDAQ